MAWYDRLSQFLSAWLPIQRSELHSASTESGLNDCSEAKATIDPTVDQFVAQLSGTAKELGSISTLKTESEEVYADVLSTGTELLSADFSTTFGSPGASDDTSETAYYFFLEEAFALEVVDRYSNAVVAGTIDQTLQDAYRTTFGSELLDMELDDKRRDTVSGYLFGETILRVVTNQLSTFDQPADLTVTVRGSAKEEYDCTVQLTELRSTASSDTDDTILVARYFVEKLLNHLETRAEQQYYKALRRRYDGFGENYRESRKLETLFDRWDQYSGTLPFHRFVDQYRRQYLDPDDPTTDVIDELWLDTPIPVEGFIDGIERWKKEHTD